MEIVPIADFRCPLKSKFGIPRQSGIVRSLEGEIVLRKEFRDGAALRGLADFDYIWVIWGFSENRKRDWQPLVRPPRLGGNAGMGVFATRSPYRPNPLGLSSLRVTGVGDGVIKVSGADLMDRTPIYDIKPYVSYTDSHEGVRNGFVDANAWNEVEVIFPEDLQRSLAAICGGNAVETVIQLLSQDPRPRYQDDPDKVYGMNYGDADVRFSVKDNILTVKEIKELI